MSALPKPFLTPHQYLEIERAAEFRSEYYHGEMFAMAGAGFNHNKLVVNLARELSQQLRGRPCTVFTTDARVRVSEFSYTYPDVVAFCGEPLVLDGRFDTLLNPGLIIEVLSPSTEAYDRGRKFEQYKEIQTLREYLLVASDRLHVDLYTRLEDGKWLLTSADGPDAVVNLESVDAQLTLSDIYEKVDFTAA